MKKKMLFFVNPNAGHAAIRSSLMDVLQIFSAGGYDVTVHPTTGPKNLTHEIVSRGAQFDLIVCTGGDGTLNEAVSGLMQLPEEIRPKSGYGNTYAKLWWDRPSTTVTRNFACPSSSRCIHPRDSRAMSIREGARLQSFPDSYRFYGSDTMKRLEIGNAVPPLLSVALAEKVLELFE